MSTIDAASSDPWLEATSLHDLGELMAQWVEGKHEFCPTNGGLPDSETTSIASYLTVANRHGFLTTFSQPAVELDDYGSAQRAAVDGFAREELAKHLYTLGLCTELLVLIYRPGEAGGYQIPITLEEFRPFTWCGPSWGYEELEEFERTCGPLAVAELMIAWKVVLIDLQCGREDYLWSNLEKAILDPTYPPDSYSSEPASDLGTEFIS